MMQNESTPREGLESVAEEVVDIARTWVETGFAIALGAVGAAADALRSTGEHLARMGEDFLPDYEIEEVDEPEREIEEVDDEPQH